MAFNIPGWSIGDLDGDTLTVTLTASSTVTLGQTTNLTVTGNGTSVVIIEGLAADIEAALEASGGLLYTPTADFNGTGTIDVDVTDGTVALATQTLNITVDPVNDAPEFVNLISNGDFETVDTGGDLTRINLGDADWHLANWDVTWTATSIDAGITDLSRLNILFHWDFLQTTRLDMPIPDRRCSRQLACWIQMRHMKSTST